jgi:hypothetical protein
VFRRRLNPRSIQNTQLDHRLLSVPLRGPVLLENAIFVAESITLFRLASARGYSTIGLIICLSPGARFTKYLNRPEVQRLTSGVKGSCQASYLSCDEAFSVYGDLKKRELLKIIRVPGDEALFGPLSEAIQ